MTGARQGRPHSAGAPGRELTVVPLQGIPLVSPGDDLAGLLVASIARAGLALEARDILVVAQKVVSKAEGRLVDLATLAPSPEAHRIAALVDKDPRLVECILSDTRRIVRAARGVLVVETHSGFVCANAGVDVSNVPGGDGIVALLPADPDRSARHLRAALAERLGEPVPAVIIIDSHGRPWRLGTVGVAIGAAGVGALDDLRGRPDLYGRPLVSSTVGRIDGVAAAAALVMGEADEGIPAAVVRGLVFPAADGLAADLLRPEDEDLFR